jgi:hypothetical protein
LQAAFVSHIKEDAGRFKHWTKNNALTRLLKRGVKNAKKNVQSIATSDTTVSKPLDANASSKPAFTGQCSARHDSNKAACGNGSACCPEESSKSIISWLKFKKLFW